jgi:hypothetical protein
VKVCSPHDICSWWYLHLVKQGTGSLCQKTEAVDACAALAADSWAQALSLQAQPASAAQALQQRLEIADIIWHAAGDRSTDFNW